MEYEIILPPSSQTKKCNVIFLLGWVGSEKRQLDKYSAIYESKGFAVVPYYPSVLLFTSFNPETTLEGHASRLIQVLRDNRLTSNPIYFHCFSAGVIMYFLLCRQLQKMENGAKLIAGSIFDSCPIMPSPKAILEFASSVVPGSVVTKHAITCAFVALAGVSYAVHFLRDVFTGNPTEAYRYFHYFALRKQRNLGPQLFLFSKADKITDYRAVQAFAAVRRQKGVKTDTLCWEDTEHVAHLKGHPEEYRCKVNSFLRMCAFRGYGSSPLEVLVGKILNKEKFATEILSRL